MTSTQNSEKDLFNRNDWASAYLNVEKEFNSYELPVVKGSIPEKLKGCFYRNGPGRLERNGHWVHHPFDGDGMIASINFQHGKASFSNRYVRTKEWIEEEIAGEFLYRGVFGTQKKGGALSNAFDLRLKNIANTNVIKIGKELLALWEAANPYSLNPDSLETNGLSNLNGVLKKGEAFSAHPRFELGHNDQPRMVTFSVNTGPKSKIRLMEFATEGPNAANLLSERTDQFPGFAFLHDFAITPNWAIFLQNSINFNPIPFILGKKGAAQCLTSNTQKNGKFLIIPRESGIFSGQDPYIIEAPKGFVFHHLNAYEKDEKTIILDSIFYKDFPTIDANQNFREIDFNKLPEGILKRCEIDLENNSLQTKIHNHQCCEFAMVNPQFQGLKARYCWMAATEQLAGNGPLQIIKKLDLINNDQQIWSCAPRGFVSEPLMVPNSDSTQEDVGWIIDLIWNAERRGTDLIILNSEDLQEEAVIEIPIGIPHGLHGCWVPN